MSDAVETKRRSKREVIVIDDDEPAEQPIAKRKPEAVSEVVELRQQVAKSNENYQRTCAMLGQEKERVRFLENLIDTKRDVVDADQKTREELEQKVDDMTNELYDARWQRQADKMRIENLTARLAEFERLQLLQQPRPQQLQSAATQTLPVPPVGDLKEVTATPEEIANLNKTGHLCNILDLCHPDSWEAMSLDDALEKLHAAFDECGVQKFYEKGAQTVLMRFGCAVCRERHDQYTILSHFFSMRHIRLTRARGSAVSYWAVHYWLRHMAEAVAAAAEKEKQEAAAPIPTYSDGFEDEEEEGGDK